MTRYSGDDGVVDIGGTAVGQVRSWEYNEEGERIPVPAMGDTTKQALAGKPEVSGSVTFWYDDADAGQILAIQGASLALNLRQRGTGSGLPQYAIATAEVLSLSERVEVDAGLEATFTWVANSAVVKTDQV